MINKMKHNSLLSNVLKNAINEPKRENTFYKILENVKDTLDGTNKTLYACLLSQMDYTYKNSKIRIHSFLKRTKKQRYFYRYKHFHEHYQNIFFSDETKEGWLLVFSKIQKYYMALNRFAYVWKIKHATIVNETDLYLNPINPSKNTVIVLYQSNKIFHFTVKDMMTIVQNEVSKADEDFEIVSEMPRNPFNKEKFTICHMYNIYLQMRYKLITTIPEIFDKWFRLDFSLDKLESVHNILLQKHAIKKFIWNVDETKSYYINDIHEMFSEYKFRNDKQIKINEGFPKKALVEKTRSYMYIYYLLKYASFDDTQYNYYENILNDALYDFSNTHPGFGRLYLKTIPNKFKSSDFDKRWNQYVKSQENQEAKKMEIDEPKKEMYKGSLHKNNIIYVYDTNAPTFNTKHL